LGFKYSDHAGSHNKAAHSIFVKKICTIETNSTKLKVLMQPGKDILEQVQSIIEDTSCYVLYVTITKATNQVDVTMNHCNHNFHSTWHFS